METKKKLTKVVTFKDHTRDIVLKEDGRFYYFKGTKMYAKWHPDILLVEEKEITIKQGKNTDGKKE